MVEPSGLKSTCPDEALVRERQADGLRDLPESSRAIEAAGQDRAAVGAERDRGDRVLMAEEAAQRPAGRHLPEPGGAVVGAREDQLAVGTERDGADAMLMAHRLADGPAGGGIPQPGGPIVAAREDGLRPSGLNATDETQSSWVIGGPIGSPVRASQSWAVRSQLAVRTVRPSGLNATPSI